MHQHQLDSRGAFLLDPSYLLILLDLFCHGKPACSLLYVEVMEVMERQHDKRDLSRRKLRIPVICYPGDSRYEPRDWIFGETVDVDPDGLRIRYRGPCRLMTGQELHLLILQQGGQDLPHEGDVPACIRGRVAWVEQEQQVFSLEYITQTTLRNQ